MDPDGLNPGAVLPFIVGLSPIGALVLGGGILVAGAATVASQNPGATSDLFANAGQLLGAMEPPNPFGLLADFAEIGDALNSFAEDNIPGHPQNPCNDEPRMAGMPRRNFRSRALIFDIPHIINHHAPWGKVALERAKKVGRSKDNGIFNARTEQEISSMVKGAWKNRKIIGNQFNKETKELRYILRGVDSRSGQKLEFWYNRTTRTVETAYPL